MRRRYFSPDLKDTLQTYKAKEPPKLRWMGSQVKLSSSMGFDEQQEGVIGNYIYYKNKQIGAGYSSKVYKAYKINDNTQYAVKIIDLKKYSPANMQMLANQIRILKSMNHPNVLKCYEIYKTATQCFIITEYCNNGDLLSQLSKKGRFSCGEAVQIISDVIAGYKYLCERYIIHRDLKPANILRSGDRWKIADFGFAIQSESEIKTKYNVGTPLYMPPEALIQNYYSVKSDIFSIGIIFYELLVGCTPWQSRTEKDLIKKMLNLSFRIPEKYKIPEELKQILEKMCDIKIKKRMDRNQFLSLSLPKSFENEQNPEQKSKQIYKSLLLKEKSVQYLKDRLNYKSVSHLSKINLITSKSIAEAHEDSEQRKKESFSNELIISQLHYCRFLYYLIRNSNCIIGQKKQAQKLILLIFSHLVKLVKLIGDPNKNYLHIQDWERFKKSKKYLNTSLTIKQYFIRYEKEYLSFLKTVEIETLREVNQMFQQKEKVNFLGLDFYTKLMQTAAVVLRNFNHRLGTKFLNIRGEITKDQAGQIEALKSVFKYYQLLEMSISHFEDFQYFQTNSKIKVNIDYKKSGANLQTYMQLRKKMKNI